MERVERLTRVLGDVPVLADMSSALVSMALALDVFFGSSEELRSAAAEVGISEL